jgi:hypothetical protein
MPKIIFEIWKNTELWCDNKDYFVYKVYKKLVKNYIKIDLIKNEILIPFRLKWAVISLINN